MERRDTLSNELIFLILQFCHEEKFEATCHALERDSLIFFDLKYFEELIVSGDWNEAEKYLSAFISVEDDKYSTNIYFEIRKQKFLEALAESNRERALDIFMKDLKVFSLSHQKLHDEMALLVTSENFRSHSLFALSGDAFSARKMLMNKLRSDIEECPSLREKLKFPDINNNRLRRLMNHSLNWQHSLCKNPLPEPKMRSIFEDHQCPLPDRPSIQSVHSHTLPYRANPASVSPSVCLQTSNQFTINDFVTPNEPLRNWRPINPDATVEGVRDPSGIHTTSGSFNMHKWPARALLQTQSSLVNISDDLPKTVGRTLELDSSPTSMHFHPVEQHILLVGTNVGSIELRNVISGKTLLTRKFTSQSRDAITLSLLMKNAEDPHISVNRTLWSSDGSLFGVAFSKQIVHLYSYLSPTRVQVEINAHVGGVNDIAFSQPLQKHLIITCGDDKLIKVWDATTGVQQHTFEGHKAPVYSLCSHTKENIDFLYSSSTNGEIKAWLFDRMRPVIEHDSPSMCCMRMVYAADGKRLYSCGTNKDGESRIVELNEINGSSIRSYQGLGKCSSGGVVKFDVGKSRFLAAGDDHLIKVWDPNNIRLLATIDADKDLPENPYICFNKESTFLAAFANRNRIKILANKEGLQSLKVPTNRSAKNLAVAQTSEKVINKRFGSAQGD